MIFALTFSFVTFLHSLLILFSNFFLSSLLTLTPSLAKVLLLMLNKRSTIEILNSQLNTYHFSDDGFCSWYDFAKAIFELSNISCEVNPVVTKDYTSQAKRPKYNVMSKEKIKYLIPSLIIPHWRESLVSCLVELKNRDN